jgi:hypothetical protein
VFSLMQQGGAAVLAAAAVLHVRCGAMQHAGAAFMCNSSPGQAVL